MPYSVDNRGDGFYIVRMQAPLTFEELLSAIEESESFTGSEYELWDLTATDFNFTGERLYAIARRARAKPKRPKKTAIVVSRELAYGLTQVYAAYTPVGNTEIKVFRSEEEALIWLGFALDSDNDPNNIGSD